MALAGLAEVDPGSANRIKPTDAQRIQRALEVFELAGEPLSSLQRSEAAGYPGGIEKVILGAPDRAAALPRAHEEAEFASSLCDHPINTLLCVERSLSEAGIVERFRTVRPAADQPHAPIWQIVED